MTVVKVRNGKLDEAINKFKTKSARDGIPSAVKSKKHHVKPGEKRR